MTAATRACLERLLSLRPPRAGSLVISVFGDCIAEQGGSIWLGSLVAALAEFGLNSRQVRTAVFRLGQDGWLSSQLRGRRSYCAFSPSGQNQYGRAADRIYAAQPAAWDGEWTLVMPLKLEVAAREELRRRLGWLGFGPLASGVLAHPRTDDRTLHETVAELALTEQVVVWRARADEDDKLLDHVRGAWDLEALAERYRAFVADFQPLYDLVAKYGIGDDRDAFVARIVMIHEYRRLLLKTADLPAAVLPADWPGTAAMQLVREIYALIQAPACRYACVRLSNNDGPLPPPRAAFYRRFGGLDPLSAQDDAAA